jgi:hypothetical protein
MTLLLSLFCFAVACYSNIEKLFFLSKLRILRAMGMTVDFGFQEKSVHLYTNFSEKRVFITLKSAEKCDTL